MAENFNNYSENFDTSQESYGDVLESLKNELNSQIKNQLLLEYALKDLSNIDKNNKGEIEKFKSRIDTFNKIESKILKYKKGGEELFLEYVFYNDNKKDYILSIIEGANSRTLKKYTKKNGYIINDETFSLFEDEFSSKEDKLNFKEREEEVTEREEEVTEREEEVTEREEEVTEEEEKERKILKSIFNDDILEKLNNESLSNIIKNINKGINIKKNIGELNQVLFDNKELLFKILQLLNNKKDGSYEKFTDFLVTQKGFSFSEKILQFETVNHINPIKTSTTSAIIEYSTKYNSKYLSDLGEHMGLITDINKIPPESFITNGEYKLKTETGVGNFYEPTVRYEIDSKKINKEIDGVNNDINLLNEKKQKIEGLDLSSDNGENELYSMFVGNAEISSLIEKYDFPLDTEKSNELKGQINKILEIQYNSLIEEYNILKKEFEERTEQYYEELEALKKEYFDKIGEEQKETLKFVNTIGLDTIPQSVIQPILEMVSGGNPIHIGNEIITGIDLANFTFEGTFSPSLGDGGIDDLNSKKVFMKLSNKMMTGDENYPINIDSYTLGSKPSFRWKIDGEEDSYEQISDIDLETRINSNFGSMPDSVIKHNLGWLDEK